MKKYPHIFIHISTFSLCFTTVFLCHNVFASTAPSAIAEIELCTGQIQLTKQDKTAKNDGTLGAGDTLQTTDNLNSRCRIVFANGNAIHVGSATTVKFDTGQQVSLLQGRLLAYAMPTLGQQEQPMLLRIDNGVLTLAMGNVLATAVKDKREVAIFNDLVSAVWHDKQGEKILYPGSLINLSSATLDSTPTPANLEAEVSEQMSPETPAVNQATQAFKNRDLVTSARLFRQIQHAFPYNTAASYYLGLFDLKDNKVSQAVQQWRKYDQIDPDGAKKTGVTQQLTLMNTQAIQEEVKQAIANENTLSRLAPEPYSVAVHPLINKGAERYLPIGKGLTAFVITDLAKVPGLKVLEREKLQKLIDEIKLSESGELVEKSARVRAGRIMRAEKLMIGDYLIEPKKVGQ